LKITIEKFVNSDINTVWDTWNNPEDIKQWNAASDDWHTTESRVDLREGGEFSARMEAKDGSMGFDFGGTYTRVVPQELIEFKLADERTVRVEFAVQDEGTYITETFDAENENDPELQRQGWQSILDAFARHVEADTAGQAN
jgi:uncharacterized protein YndB with AHSA1/START domain